jgi:two-component system, OmpR family, phosphate regulon sensor histidine kinase PhoR
MNPSMVFWIPAILRITLVVSAALVVGYFFGIMWSAIAFCTGLLFLIFLQLHYLFRLSIWLNNPKSNLLPEGWGAWTEIFSRLYQLRCEDEKNQAELSEWLTRFRQAMTLLPDGVVIMDDVMFLEWCNPVAEQHFGLDLGKDRTMRITSLIRHPELVDYLILGRFDKPITITYRDRKLVLHVIQFENRRQILVTHDITESERIDMMRRDFIANASHELRTPLTVINGFLEINAMQPDLDSKTRAEHVKLMSEQGQRMQSLVDDMLTLTRLESVDFPIRLESIKMSALLEQIASEFHGLSLGKHQLTLTNEGPDIEGSYDELHSAFSNLVSNAVRYTPEGGQITISWTNSDVGPKFTVKDSGIGISAEHLARLTERFYRVDKGISRQTRGTGLGLAIVKHVSLRHKAQLSIVSTVDVGSEFSIQFSKNNTA